MEQYLIPILTNILLALVPLVFVLVYALVTIYVEMKMAAHIQNRLAYMRTGWHGVLQPIADMLKLLQKEDTIPTAANKGLFVLAPYVVFTGTYAAFAVIPFSSAYVGSNIDLGAFYLIGVSALVVVGILMGGWAANSRWTLYGGVRSAAQVISYEIPSAFVILAVVMVTGSMNFSVISKFQEGGIQNWLILGGAFPLAKKLALMPFMLIMFLIYYVSSMAETNRNPFDLPEAESELVQGYNTEYSGMKFAMFYLAEYANLFIVSAVVTFLFFGGWTSPLGATASGPWWDAFWFVTKCMMFVVLNIWLRWTLPRFRVDQLMYMSWKVLTPFAIACVLAVGLILVW